MLKGATVLENTDFSPDPCILLPFKFFLLFIMYLSYVSCIFLRLKKIQILQSEENKKGLHC